MTFIVISIWDPVYLTNSMGHPVYLINSMGHLIYLEDQFIILFPDPENP